MTHFLIHFIHFFICTHYQILKGNVWGHRVKYSSAKWALFFVLSVSIYASLAECMAAREQNEWWMLRRQENFEANRTSIRHHLIVQSFFNLCTWLAIIVLFSWWFTRFVFLLEALFHLHIKFVHNHRLVILILAYFRFYLFWLRFLDYSLIIRLGILFTHNLLFINIKLSFPHPSLLLLF